MPDPCAYNRIGRGVRKFDNTTWDSVREDAVFACIFAKFSHTPIMKQHFLSTGTKRLSEASLFYSVWGIGFREDDNEASNTCRWPGICFLGKAIPIVRDAIRISETRLVNSAVSHQFCAPTSPAEFVRFLRRRLALWLWPTHAHVLLWNFDTCV